MLRLLAIIATLVSCRSTSPRLQARWAGPETIQYTVRFLSDALQVEAVFRGDPTGETKITLPMELYESKKPFDGIRDLEVRGAGARFETPDITAIQRTIRHDPSAVLTVRYRIVQTSTDKAKNVSPMISREFVHINGATLFAMPDGDPTRKLKIDLTWTDLPKGWTIANSFGASEIGQQIDATRFDLLTSIFVAGDFRLTTLDIAGRPVIVALRGTWKFSDNAVLNLVKKIMTEQRRFWNDFDVPYYFVLLMPNGRPCCSFGGHGLTHSFVSYFSEEEFSLKRFSWVLAHENFHYWNGEKMMGGNDGLEYWFTEGLTDYYSRILNLRAGVIDYSDLVDDMNGQIYKYYAMKDRESTNAKIAGSGSTAIPQTKGNVFAGNWDLAIRKASGGGASLDDFMRALLLSLKGAKLTNAAIEKELAEFVGAPEARLMMHQIETGELIKPEDGALGPCAKVEDLKTGKFQAGFDEPYGAKTVAKVIADSNAFAAGLRDNQVILDRNDFDFYKPWVPFDLKVKDAEGERRIRFLPQKKEKLNYPHFVLRKNPSKKCARWFEGQG